MSEQNTSIHSLRIYRPVQKTAEADLVRATIEEIGLETIGHTQTSMLRTSTLEDESGEDGVMKYTGVLVPKANIFPVDDWNLGLYERHAPTFLNYGTTFLRGMSRVSTTYQDHRRRPRITDEETEEPELSRNPLHVRLEQNGLAHDIPDTQKLHMKFVAIQQTNDPRNTNLDRTYAFVPEYPSYAVDQANDEINIITGAILKMGVGKDIVWPASPTSVHVRFAEVPADVSDEARHEFLNRVRRSCLPFYAILGPIKYG